MDLTVKKTTPIVEPMAQLNIGADFSLVSPPDGKVRGYVSARPAPAPRMGGRVPETTAREPHDHRRQSVVRARPRGWLRALDATNGKELWKHNNSQGHNGGIISYKGKDGRQYVAVETGWGGLAGDDFMPRSSARRTTASRRFRCAGGVPPAVMPPMPSRRIRLSSKRSRSDTVVGPRRCRDSR
jgi:hypothetical protein